MKYIFGLTNTNFFFSSKGIFGNGLDCNISNINFDNVTITSNSPTTEYMGLISYSLCNLNQIKLTNSNFKMEINQTNSLLLGGMCGYCSTYQIQNCESTNNTFEVKLNTTDNKEALIGGIGGDFNFFLISNNFF